MFYPVDSLKRGGRFYLCWIADSWPLRFQKLTHRNQRVWSQDIREICDALRELMTSESGRPTHRFSLRLSSQLMRGLARVYQKKVELFVRDVYKINTNVIRYRSHHEPSERVGVPRRRPVVHGVQRLFIEEMPDEENMEKLIENSDNLVARVEDITLREPTLPSMRLIEDGFGELNQDPVEMMLAHEVSVMQQSALDLPLDFSTDKSHDKSRLLPHDAAQMERISEHDISVFRKSAGEAPTLVDFEKEIPDISEILPSELPAPEPQNKVIEQPLEEARVEEPIREQHITEMAKQIEYQDIVLEDLEGEPQPKRRKMKNKLVIDKSTQLSSNYLRARIGNNNLELRCQDMSEDVIAIHTPASMLLNRPTRSGPAQTSRFSHTLGAMFSWRLANAGKIPAADREVEEARIRRSTIHLDPVEREIQADTSDNKTVQAPEVQGQVVQDISNIATDISMRNIPEGEVSMLPAQDAIAMADLPTQKLLTVSQENQASENDKAPKKRRLSQRSRRSLDISAISEANKENIPVAVNIPPAEIIPVNVPHLVLSVDDTERPSNVQTLASMLQEAGLADAQEKPTAFDANLTQRERRINGSESTDTPLGSLDRTKVSLGESEKISDSKKFINEEWGTQGTMFKIFRCVVQEVSTITVDSLVRRGPVIEGRRRIIAARCFSSILNLKSHNFIKVIKNEETNEIKHIELGPRITIERERYVN